jgi:uncharacterized membrane protein
MNGMRKYVDAKNRNLLELSLILLIASAGCAGLVLVRSLVMGYFTHFFLLWNLFLAWTPYLISLLLVPISRLSNPLPKRVLVSLVGLFWIVFYPNSPYIFTDLIHVIKRNYPKAALNEWITPDSLLWFDIILNATVAFTGHFIGLISLYLVHESIRKAWNHFVGWAVAVFAIGLAGMGIYIGRFARLNSWDIITRPLQTLLRISRFMVTPRALLFSLGFAFFIASTYLMLYIFKKTNLGDAD